MSLPVPPHPPHDHRCYHRGCRHPEALAAHAAYERQRARRKRVINRGGSLPSDSWATRQSGRGRTHEPDDGITRQELERIRGRL